jgi:hypothetical protein
MKSIDEPLLTEHINKQEEDNDKKEEIPSNESRKWQCDL